ncbi:MAG: biotin--[acetyl-CoA-carboxylase] ligase [Clostridia bacterium]|nr:biotin--[acetyl-CoA-carboxylase] ligase [Clostridia bacterium]
MLSEDILALLRAQDGELSGEAMSQTLGVSRAAVWKAVEQLRALGYRIASAPRRGYRLEDGPDRVTAGELTALLGDCALGREIVCLDTVDSTSSEIKRRAALGAASGLTVIAEEQSLGRGRRGNAFQSLRGKGLYLSVLMRPRAALEDLGTLTAHAAVAVREGILSACGAACGIKWTNDLILNGKKLCGILTELELEGESGAVSHVVLGVGINVSQTAEDFGQPLSHIATSLGAEGFVLSRTELAAAVLRALGRMDRQFPAEREECRKQYRANCVTLGREVYLCRNEERIPVFAEDLDRDFALVVRHPDGRRERITAGDVPVRGLMGYI